jgi:hypothetical protein
MTSSASDPNVELSDAARAAFAEKLGTTDFEIAGAEFARLPSGEEVRLIHAIVPGDPNRSASFALDSSDAVQPRRALEAIAGRDLFMPSVELSGAPDVSPAETVSVDPAVNDLVLPECAIQHETITVTVPVSGVRPKADVYLLADTTGSMSSIIGAVQAGVNTIITAPQLIGFDLAWGVGNYKDFPIPGPTNGNPYAFQHQLAPTTNLADVATAVGTWTANGGEDTPEGQLYALQQVATDPAIGWRTDSKRILVWFGDAPGHDPICAVFTAAADVTEATATAALLASPGITVVAISTDTGTLGALDGDPTAGSADYGTCPIGGTAGQATRITDATPGGSHTTGVDAGSIVTTLVDLISSAVHTILNLDLEASGGIDAFVTSISPAGGYGPLPGDVEHVLQFEVTWSGVKECAEEEQVFTGSLDVVADGVVVGSKAVTIRVPACQWHHSVEMICGSQLTKRDDGDGHDHGTHDGGDHDDEGECQTVVDGRYATAVTIYNPCNCVVELVKYFAPLVLQGKPVGREPEKVRARPFFKMTLEPGEATMEDCCSLEEAVGPTGGPLVLGVLDVVADHPLHVTVTHTAAGKGQSVTSLDARTIEPRRC